MLIVATVHSRTDVPAIQERLAIRTKLVDPSERHRVVKRRVESELNVVKMAFLLIVYVHPDISAIHLSSVMTSTNVRTAPVVKEQFVSTHREATIVNVNQDRLGELILNFEKKIVSLSHAVLATVAALYNINFRFQKSILDLHASTKECLRRSHPLPM